MDVAGSSPTSVSAARTFSMAASGGSASASAAGRPHQVQHGQERDRAAEGQATPLEISDRPAGQRVPELEEQPRLADPGFADDAHHLSASGLHLDLQGAQRADLPGTSDELAQGTLAARLQRRAALAASDDQVDGHWHRPAADLHRALGLELRVATDELRRGVADHDGAGFGHLLQAGRQVGRVADGGVVHPEVVADGPHDDEAGMKPEAKAHRHWSARLHLERLVVQNAPQVERGQYRAARVILVRQRRPEQRHEPIAQELVDRPLVAVDLGNRPLRRSG